MSSSTPTVDMPIDNHGSACVVEDVFQWVVVHGVARFFVNDAPASAWETSMAVNFH